MEFIWNGQDFWYFLEMKLDDSYTLLLNGERGFYFYFFAKIALGLALQTCLTQREL